LDKPSYNFAFILEFGVILLEQEQQAKPNPYYTESYLKFHPPYKVWACRRDLVVLSGTLRFLLIQSLLIALCFYLSRSSLIIFEGLQKGDVGSAVPVDARIFLWLSYASLGALVVLLLLLFFGRKLLIQVLVTRPIVLALENKDYMQAVDHSEIPEGHKIVNFFNFLRYSPVNLDRLEDFPIFMGIIKVGLGVCSHLMIAGYLPSFDLEIWALALSFMYLFYVFGMVALQMYVTNLRSMFF
jgi:hypothetical protein